MREGVCVCVIFVFVSHATCNFTDNCRVRVRESGECGQVLVGWCRWWVALAVHSTTFTLPTTTIDTSDSGSGSSPTIVSISDAFVQLLSL